jgi:hypothetical protein
MRVDLWRAEGDCWFCLSDCSLPLTLIKVRLFMKRARDPSQIYWVSAMQLFVLTAVLVAMVPSFAVAGLATASALVVNVGEGNVDRAHWKCEISTDKGKLAELRCNSTVLSCAPAPPPRMRRCAVWKSGSLLTVAFHSCTLNILF